MTDREFLKKIEAFLKETGMAASTFGTDARGDPNFVFNLRKGSEVTLRVVNEVVAFMEKELRERING